MQKKKKIMFLIREFSFTDVFTGELHANLKNEIYDAAYKDIKSSEYTNKANYLEKEVGNSLTVCLLHKMLRPYLASDVRAFVKSLVGHTI